MHQKVKTIFDERFLQNNLDLDLGREKPENI